MSGNDDQAEVLAFLRDPASWPDHPERVDVVETHGAIVFLAGAEALKVRRAVTLPYLDFSTLEARRRFAEREIAINTRAAPDIYRGVVAISREPDGRLAIGGRGEPVEWAVRMTRFDQDALLSHMIRREPLPRTLAIELADAVARLHQAAPAAQNAGDPMPAIVAGVARGLTASSDPRVAAAAARWRSGAERLLAQSAEVRIRRARAGFVRRCHGDLHLGNIVLWHGHPVPFDAIEFDEALATIDTLYDLAFLLMDLERQGAREAANAVLSRYLWRTGFAEDVQGLAALPLFIATRAAIRAMVGLDRARLGADRGPDPIGHALDSLALADRAMTPPPARLVAIGGLSGTGKSTLAAAISPAIGAIPGALHLRSDLERKRLAGVEEDERLGPASYTPETAAAVYARLMERTRLALTAGHSVVVDAVFARPGERDTVEAIARDAGARFDGVWLDGVADVLKARVAARQRDASDATPAVVERQLAQDVGPIAWARIDAGPEPQAVAEAARQLLRIGR